MSAYINKLRGAESGHKATAKNPYSSAYGADQFISGTWLTMVKKYRPDLLKGRTTQQVLALRANPDLSAFMADKYRQENAAVLRKAGLPVTDETLYLAHGFGAGGAVTLLKTPANTPFANTSVGTDKVLRQNPTYRGKTVGQIIEMSNRRFNKTPSPKHNDTVDKTAALKKLASLPMVSPMPDVQSPSLPVSTPNAVTPVIPPRDIASEIAAYDSAFVVNPMNELRDNLLKAQYRGEQDAILENAFGSGKETEAQSLVASMPTSFDYLIDKLMD